MKRSHTLSAAMMIATLVSLTAAPQAVFAETVSANALMSLPLPISPPELNFAKICRKAQSPAPLSFDWKTWSGERPQQPANEILADANRLIDGGAGVMRDLPLARRLLEVIVEERRATGLGAKRRLAQLLLDERAGTVDRERAARLLIEATAAQETDAALTLGRLLARGELPALPLEDASRYLGVAAGFGEPMAAVELAALYADETLSPPFEGAARHFANLATLNLQTALAQGDCDLAIEIGQFLVDRGYPDAERQAVAWFTIAANAGHRAGLEKLAKAYDNGIGVTLDRNRAGELWELAVAAGSVAGYAALADLALIRGDDPDQIEALLSTGVENGDPSAVLLAARYFRGDFTGSADFDRMQAVLQPAAERPETSVFALDILANSYLTGQGVAPDPARAEALYQRINAHGTPDAQALYGRYLLKWGRGLREAEAVLRQAADAGSGRARAGLVDLSLCQPSSQLDPDQWLQAVAADGNALAIRKLARRALETGDKSKAQVFFEQAAEQGDRISMVERAAVLIAEAGGPTKRSKLLIAQAGAAGEGVVSGRLALVGAYRAGKLGEDLEASASLLDGLRASLDPAADFELARISVEEGTFNEDAQRRLERAAVAGHVEAMQLLARQLTIDGGSSVEADAWLQRAAERGDPEALAELGSDPARLAPVAKALDDVLLCDPRALVEKARLQRILGEPLNAAKALSNAEAIVRHSPRLRLVLAEAILSLSPSANDDAARAARLLEGAADGGSGKAAFVLARLQEGDRLGHQRDAAIKWYSKAALTGEQAAIGELTRLSEGGGAKDAMDALKRVAEAGDPSALRSFGMLLAARGQDSRSEGIRLLEDAAAKKDVAAMKILARFHAAGIDGEVSAAKSISWTRLAAEQGDPEAMFQYAIALDLGFGVDPDPQSAKTWHRKALQNGYVE